MADLTCLCLEAAPGYMSSRSFHLPSSSSNYRISFQHSFPHYSLFTFSRSTPRVLDESRGLGCHSSLSISPLPLYNSTLYTIIDSSRSSTHHDHRLMNSIDYHLIRPRRHRSVILDRPGIFLRNLLPPLPPLLPPSRFRDTLAAIETSWACLGS